MRAKIAQTVNTSEHLYNFNKVNCIIFAEHLTTENKNMKAKTKFIYSLLGILLIVSCQPSDELSGDPADKMQGFKELDLLNSSYSEFKNLLNGHDKIDNILLKDGSISKKITTLAQDKLINSSDIENQNQDFFYHGAPEDSTCVILNNEYASVNFRHNGEELGYVIYSDPSKNQELIEAYSRELPATRSADGRPITRSTTTTAPIRINLTEGRKLRPDDEEYCRTFSSESVDSNESPVATRSAYYTQWPRGNTLTIHLIRDMADMPWEHEIGWQINDLKHSLSNIRRDINYKVWRSTTGYKSSNNGYTALYNFKEYCESNRFPWKEAAGHDIIMLIRHWGWDGVNGLSFVNTYTQSRYENDSAYGITTTSAWNNRTMAHEVGHIFGAEHTGWGFSHWLGWTLYLGYDLMVPRHNLLEWSLHFDSGNRRRIYNNLF